MSSTKQDEATTTANVNGAQPNMPMAESGILGQLVPLGQEFTLSGVTGFCSGYATKKIGQAAAFTIGVSFIGLQVLAYNGFIEMKWGRIQQSVINRIDTDGDGKITGADVRSYAGKLMRVLQYQLPNAGGFAAGFALGLRYA